MRILLVSSRHPRPPWRGNQVRTLQVVEALEGHELGLVCPRRPDGGPALADVREWSWSAPPVAMAAGAMIAAVTGRPLQEGLYRVPAARRTLAAALAAERWDLVVIQMVRCAWAMDEVHRRAPETPLLFDAIDSMGLHFGHAAQRGRPTARPLFAVEAARCRRRERWMARQAAVTCAVSQRDLDALGALPSRARLVPVAAREVARRRPSPSPIVLLSGNLGYRPTVEGARWFARAVWPAVHRRLPAARWMIAGARPAPAVRRLAGLPGVEVHADVADLGGYLARATVAVAPMNQGSGVAMKVLEAWASGVPVVADPWTAAGLQSAPEPGVAVASSPEQWVGTLLELLGDAAAAREVGRRGRAVWERWYSPARVRDAVAEAVRRAVSGRVPPATA